MFSLPRQRRDAFARQDAAGYLALSDGFVPSDDSERLCLAWALLSVGRAAEAEALIASFAGDGSITLADRAYVQAFAAEQRGETDRVLDLLQDHLTGESKHFGARLRLRCADALVKLGRHGEVQATLGPLLQPPGTDLTLEAQFIVLESMLAVGKNKEVLIEQVTLLDLLVERGFRLGSAELVVYYASLMNRNRIEPVLGPLLKSHADLLEEHVPADRDEVEFLLAVGDKHKAPAAIRAAARGYLKNPFAWGGDFEGDKVGFLFASHEEHEAARASILRSYAKSRILKEQDLWGPLILENYHAGLWKEALDLLRDKRQEVSRLQMAKHTRMVKANCELHLGRFEEALETIRSLGAEFHTLAQPPEGAAELLALERLRRYPDFPEAWARVSATPHPEHGANYPIQVAFHCINEWLLRERTEALLWWFEAFEASIADDATRRIVFRAMGRKGVEWSLPALTARAAEILASLGDEAERLRAWEAAYKRSPDAGPALEALVARYPSWTAEDGSWRETRGYWRLDLADFSGALEDAEVLLQSSIPHEVAAAHLLKGAILARRDGASAASDAEVDEGLRGYRALCQTPEQYQVLQAEAQQRFHGHRAGALLARARRCEELLPGTVETPRLLRLALQAPDAETVAEEARALLLAWTKANLNHAP